jgi:hypothetical protein
MSRFGCAVAVLVVFAAETPAASPNPKDLAVPQGELARARELVGRLGSPAFDEREDAQDDLEKMGRLALPALAEGLNASPSPEVRFRCQALIPRASALDLQARLDTFLADDAGKFDHDLPGWNEFKTVAGAAAVSRGVFVDLLADPANRALLLAVAGPPADLGTLVAARKQELYQWRFPRTSGAARRAATVADVTALLFAESRVSSKHVPRSVTVSTLLTFPGVTAALTDGGEKGGVYRAVVAEWVNTRDDAVSMYQALTVASNLNLKEATGAAVKLLTMKGALGAYRGQAAMTLVRLGGKEHLPTLEKLLGDETVLMSVVQGGKADRIEIQLRDVALVSVLLLTDQDPEEYGFTQRYKSSSAATRLSYSNWYLTADKRPAAREKWTAWRAKNPAAEKGTQDK